ncbi:hypothetical protein LP414_21230 [Polaromonas sp. P1(28)-13]|nr:hypothetical protein LP414_21230 [Polaromonas sp. P1(28)-13]
MKWFLRNWTDIAYALWEHIAISLTALTIAFALSLVIGIVAARRERLYGTVMTISGVLYTIPTLAFLAFLIPFVGLGLYQRHHYDGGVFIDDPDPQRGNRHSGGSCGRDRCRAAWA